MQRLGYAAGHGGLRRGARRALGGFAVPMAPDRETAKRRRIGHGVTGGAPSERSFSILYPLSSIFYPLSSIFHPSRYVNPIRSSTSGGGPSNFSRGTFPT